MKRVDIEIFQYAFYIYAPCEKIAFEIEIDDRVGNNDAALTCDNKVWIGHEGDVTGNCYHEASHVVDHLLEEHLKTKQGALGDNYELRAYLMAWVGTQIRNYIQQEEI